MSSGYDDGYYDGRRSTSHLHDEVEGLQFELTQQQETIEELETEIERLTTLIASLRRRKTPVRLKAKRT